jgi:hypothetical protein
MAGNNLARLLASIDGQKAIPPFFHFLLHLFANIMMSTKQDPSPRTEAALRHLRRLRPLDGYAVECYLASNGKNQVRLKRR